MQWHRFWDVARKAGLAAVVAAAGTITQAAPDGITTDEWLVVAGSAATAYFGVYTLKNRVPSETSVYTGPQKPTGG